MIDEAYVSFEVAKLLNKKGFDEECNKVIHQDTKNEYYFGNYSDEIKGRLVLVPTQQMACRWLREVHHLCIEPYRTACGYLFTVSKIWTGTEIYSAEYCGDDEASGQFTTWEDCVEYAIKYCLEHLID